MRNPFRSLCPVGVAVWALLLGSVGAAAESPPEPVGSVAGTYDISGVNRDGTVYTGVVEIVEAGQRLYQLKWQDSDSSYEGQGALLWRQLFVVWGEKGADCVAYLYEVGDDGTLSGDWFSADDVDRRGSEEARPSGERAAGAIEGTYSVEGKDPSGAAYEKELTVSPLGSGYYEFQWTDPHSTLQGLGELDEDFLVVVRKNGGQCGRMTYDVQDGGRLEGTWRMADERFELVGRETAVRRSDSSGEQDGGSPSSAD